MCAMSIFVFLPYQLFGSCETVNAFVISCYFGCLQFKVFSLLDFEGDTYLPVTVTN